MLSRWFVPGPAALWSRIGIRMVPQGHGIRPGIPSLDHGKQNRTGQPKPDRRWGLYQPALSRSRIVAAPVLSAR